MYLEELEKHSAKVKLTVDYSLTDDFSFLPTISIEVKGLRVENKKEVDTLVKNIYFFSESVVKQINDQPIVPPLDVDLKNDLIEDSEPK